MRVLAARFPDRDRASEALARLQRACDIRPPDVAIAPLGLPATGDGGDTLLAGRVPDERAPDVARLVREAGGEIVANVDESWTRPRNSSAQPH